MMSFVRRSTKNENEFYIVELDEQKSTADRSLVGKQFKSSRYIHRVGYLHEAQNLSIEDVKNKEKEMLLDLFRGVLRTLGEKEAENYAKIMLAQFKGVGFPMPSYQAKGVLVSEYRNKDGDAAKWRRMWFKNCKDRHPYINDRPFTITGTRRVITGKWYPYSGGYDYWGEYDYVPGGLDPAFYQTLYCVDFYVEMENGEFEKDFMALVHPNDLI